MERSKILGIAFLACTSISGCASLDNQGAPLNDAPKPEIHETKIFDFADGTNITIGFNQEGIPLCHDPAYITEGKEIRTEPSCVQFEESADHTWKQGYVVPEQSEGVVVDLSNLGLKP